MNNFLDAQANLNKISDSITSKYDLKKFILNGIETNFQFGEHPVYFTDEHPGAVVIIDRKVFSFELSFFEEYGNKDNFYKSKRFETEWKVPSGVFVKYKSKFENFFISNGDDYSEFNETQAQNRKSFPKYLILTEDTDIPTISFRCLGFLIEETPIKVADMLVSGDLTLVDFLPDKVVKLRNFEKGKAWQTLTPPDSSFNIVWSTYERSHIWHRSGTIVIYNKIKKETYIVGQDEGTYFGCLLPSNPKTVKQAFECLIPKEVKGKFQRQGEWFVTRVFKKGCAKKG